MNEECEEVLNQIVDELKRIKYILSDISEQNRSHINAIIKRNNDIHETNLKFRRFELENLEKQDLLSR